MAKQMSMNAVTVLPPTGGIKDSATRSFLDALSNLLDARSGYTDKDSPERFITASEFQGLANRAIFQAFTGGAGGGGFAPGSGGPGGKIPSAQEIDDSIENLANFIRKSLIYQLLGEQIDLIDISSLRQRIDAAQSGISRVESTIAGSDMALASAINTIWAAIGGSEAVIEDGSLAQATPNTAVASRWNQVQAAVTDPNTGQVSSTSILEESRSYANAADGKFNSTYSVRAQVSVGGRTVIGGFGLSATSGANSGEGPTIDFGVRADKFFIAATSETPSAATQISQGSEIPFMVLTSNQVVNGVVYGPGVYIKKAVIGNATIGNAQIADLAVTSAKIENASITSAKIQDAAITRAKIGDLQVDTLQIAGNAVTFPAGATLSSGGGYSGTFLSLIVASAGAPIWVFADFTATLGTSASLTVILRVNGNVVKSWSASTPNDDVGSLSGSGAAYSAFSATNNGVTLEAYGSGYSINSGAHIFSVGLKR